VRVNARIRWKSAPCGYSLKVLRFLCGIFGFTHTKTRPTGERAREGLRLLAHRGPDDQRAFEGDIVTLGATRLKILDLSAGSQPMVAAEGDTVIAFNGEIYNHLELRPELERLGFSFHTQTDTETLLNAFLAWDIDCFSRLRGMFAVALWSSSTKRLVLARDRIGIKPLYVARHGSELYFASEMKAILMHPEIDRKLNLGGLDIYLSLNYPAGPETLIEGIEKLRPGHWLEWRDGRVSSGAYWSLRLEQRATTTQEACEQLDSLLQQSVREHMLSDVALGVWLSGGLDSTTILHYATQASPRPLQTFSISFAGRSFDERRYIAEASRHYDTEHHELDLNTNSDLESAIHEFAYYSDEPNGDAGALPVWFLSKLTRKTATVALSGEGADELFGGYLTYRADALARRARKAPRFALQGALALARHWPVSDEKISLEYKLKRFLEGSLLPEQRAHVFWNGTFSDSEKRALVHGHVPASLDRLLRFERQDGDPLSSGIGFDQRYYLPDDILMKVDRMSMAHAVEVRTPFLDHRVVQFANSLPSRLKVSGSQQKVILKTLMKGKLPGAIIRRKKVGFDIPAHEWLRGPLRSLAVETLETVGKDFGELFNQRRINQFLQLHLARQMNLGYHLWGLTILLLWMRKWRIQVAGSPLLEHKLARSASNSL
jgi:asparagine synthase (glutamine-hydrolysing)